MKNIPKILSLLPLSLLSGCNFASFPLFNPVGVVAQAQWRFTILDVLVMMVFIVPVGVLTALFLWMYSKKRNAKYDPTWSHSLGLELLMWGIPVLIVAFLGWESYRSTLLVNPFGPTALNLDDPNNKPLEIDAVTTDWQWVFIYPEYGIATVDDMPVPAGRPVRVYLTSTSVTNDFFIPRVAPMIDVMPGMRTASAFQVDKPGRFEGISADFSGAGFSWMQFSTRVMAAGDFDAWTKQVAGSATPLSYADFQKLAHPTINIGAKPAYFSHVEPGMFMKVIADAQAGVTYPVPAEMKIPAPGPQDYTQATN